MGVITRDHLGSKGSQRREKGLELDLRAHRPLGQLFSTMVPHQTHRTGKRISVVIHPKDGAALTHSTIDMQGELTSVDAFDHQGFMLWLRKANLKYRKRRNGSSQ